MRDGPPIYGGWAKIEKSGEVIKRQNPPSPPQQAGSPCVLPQNRGCLHPISRQKKSARKGGPPGLCPNVMSRATPAWVAMGRLEVKGRYFPNDLGEGGLSLGGSGTGGRWLTEQRPADS